MRYIEYLRIGKQKTGDSPCKAFRLSRAVPVRLTSWYTLFDLFFCSVSGWFETPKPVGAAHVLPSFASQHSRQTSLPLCLTFSGRGIGHGGNHKQYGLGPITAASTEFGNTGKHTTRPRALMQGLLCWCIQGTAANRVATEQTEALFHTYSQFSTAANIPQKPTEEEKNAESKLQELLDKVRRT